MVDELLELERAFWSGDGGFYRRNLTSDCRMAFPHVGLLDRDAVIAGIEAGPRWDSVEMLDVAVRPAGEDAAVVSYLARARQAGRDYEALVGSVYVREEGAWRLAYHQHTAVTPPAGAS